MLKDELKLFLPVNIKCQVGEITLCSKWNFKQFSKAVI